MDKAPNSSTLSCIKDDTFILGVIIESLYIAKRHKYSYTLQVEQLVCVAALCFLALPVTVLGYGSA